MLSRYLYLGEVQVFAFEFLEETSSCGSRLVTGGTP